MLNFIHIVCYFLFLFISTSTNALRRGDLRDGNGDWKGPWFPYNPTNHTTPTTFQPHKQMTSNNCDDGVHSIGADFDPADKRNSYKYLCLFNTEQRKQFEPNLDTEALLSFNFISPAYVPPATCLNESISYELKVPTYGSFRPIPAKYGEYEYLPPQRWMRNLAEGAIVMLYHPCAYAGQVSILQKIVQSCLYRHIITPSQSLDPVRPLALLAWGKSLKLSVVDEKMIVNFIKEHAKHGPLSYVRSDKETNYEVSLIAEAHLITDTDDSEVCGYKES